MSVNYRDRTVKTDDLIDLHRAVLVALPPEGSKLGYHPLALTVKRVRDELNEPLPSSVPKLTSGNVTAAVRRLHLLGLAVAVKMQNGLAWQATPAGKEFVNGWEMPAFDEQQEAPR